MDYSLAFGFCLGAYVMAGVALWELVLTAGDRDDELARAHRAGRGPFVLKLLFVLFYPFLFLLARCFTLTNNRHDAIIISQSESKPIGQSLTRKL